MHCYNRTYCHNEYFPIQDVVLHHYRERVFEQSDFVTYNDTTIWKFKDQLIKAVNETLKATNFIP
jgi:hypothetical protein